MGCTCVIHLYPTLCTLLFYLKLCMYHIFVSHTVHDTLVFQVQMCQTLEHQNAHMYYSCIPNKRFLHKCACVLTCTGFNTLHCWSLSSFLELKFDLIILRWETDEKYTKKLVFHTALVPNWLLKSQYSLLANKAQTKTTGKYFALYCNPYSMGDHLPSNPMRINPRNLICLLTRVQ